MIRIASSLLLVVLCGTVAFAQTTWVADNNFNAPTGPNVFPTIQEAINAASAGDIVQVQPSPTTYGGATIDKQITLMGIGFNLDKEIPLQSKMGNISLTNNIDNTSDADGTIVMGLTIANIYAGVNTGPAFLLENILIQNCRINFLRDYGGAGYSPIDGMEIRGCHFTGAYSSQGISFAAPATNVIIRNCLLYYGIEFGSGTPGSNIVANNIIFDYVRVDAEGSNTTIINNNFIASSGGDAAFYSVLRDCIVANNIFYGSTPSLATGGNSTSVNFQRNSFTNNLVFSTGDDTMPPLGGGVGNSGSGNISGTSPLFTNVQLLDTWSGNYDFSLQPGSPAINAGSDGSDIGITGGSYPFPNVNFLLETTPAPTIQILNTTTVINPGDDLPVRINAKSN